MEKVVRLERQSEKERKNCSKWEDCNAPTTHGGWGWRSAEGDVEEERQECIKS
jgi:hypothetical protein